MCLAIPALVLSVDGAKASVDFGQGVVKDVNITLVEAKVGDYVIVHAGYALELVEKEDALETIKMWNALLIDPKKE
jgi:hydrogenase expression/formation protein HypC